VRRNFPEAVLNVYGAGEIKEFQNGEKSAGVIFHGKTDEPLMALAENGVFVLPSHKEGLSLSLLEAAMMGKTIIATDVDGNPEVVEDGVSGILVPAGDVGRLAIAMEKVLLDPRLAQKLARGARERYEQEFGFERIFAEKMLLLYNGKKENA
jgi:glycosyltransferase involved in cell wall biosynthesis